MICMSGEKTIYFILKPKQKIFTYFHVTIYGIG